ncbi:hypothetical protein SAMN05216474_1771 [Lishizhenia tianjinensis]|uniref:Uncharacterized protein n=1 Tax=Lishizhenia tianjinensis TaxID=477690 RepID=A0A1I6ZZV0_9FLAO|nr:hypothetical protein [Lishizhenia tianjinensis]SFT68218.1 hypothetical protein SAMN05216474_1771 [Lishizhenia tianjinensis]
MNEKKLISIITELETEYAESNALFGIYEDGGILPDTHIRANKEGLIHYAIHLLKAAENYGLRLEKEDLERCYLINDKIDWIDDHSDVFIQSIEPIQFIEYETQSRSRIDKIKDTTVAFGCLLTIFLIAISVFVGLGTLLNWMI